MALYGFLKYTRLFYSGVGFHGWFRVLKFFFGLVVRANGLKFHSFVSDYEIHLHWHGFV